MDFDQIYLHSKILLSKYGKADKSSLTEDRKIVWIGKQPLFTKKMEIAGHNDQFIKAIASEVYPTHDYILICGGNTEINPHRDATYAMPEAISINLGGMAYFDHEDGCKWLKHGDVTTFNCKKLHAVLEADLDRISICIWKKNPKW